MHDFKVLLTNLFSHLAQFPQDDLFIALSCLWLAVKLLTHFLLNLLVLLNTDLLKLFQCWLNTAKSLITGVNELLYISIILFESLRLHIVELKIAAIVRVKGERCSARQPIITILDQL